MIKMIMGVVDWVLSPVLNLLDFPAIPPELNTIMEQVFVYMRSGMAIIDWLCPLNLIQPCIDIFIAVYLIEHGYYLVMWVLKKIPMLGIE